MKTTRFSVVPTNDHNPWSKCYSEMLKDSRKLCNFILSFEDRHLVDLNLFFFFGPESYCDPRNWFPKWLREMNSKIKHLFCRCLHCAHHKVQGLETRHGSKDFQSTETVDCYHQDFPDGTSGRIHLPVLETQETWVWSLGQEDPLEKEVATCSSILASKTPWTEEPCKLYSLLSHKESGMTEWLSIHTHTHTHKHHHYHHH